MLSKPILAQIGEADGDISRFLKFLIKSENFPSHVPKICLWYRDLNSRFKNIKVLLRL